MAGYWSDRFIEPKRANRFVLISENVGSWVIKMANKPSFEIGESEHRYLNHTFYYPGVLTWNTIDITLVDPIGDEDSTAKIIDVLRNSGYDIPTVGPDPARGLLSKASATNALGQIRIQELGPEGVIVNEWSLQNPWIKSATFGDLSYTDEELTEITLTVRYDAAHLGPPGAQTVTG